MKVGVLGFCFAYAERNLIKFKLYYNWSAQVWTVFWGALSQIQVNQ